MPKQTTLRQAFSLEGIGLHTGAQAKIHFFPAPVNTGIVFRRLDLPGSPEIRACIDNVVEVLRGTTLGFSGARVHTVEHILSAFCGLEIDNVRIDLHGEEPPALDGSARPLVEAIQNAGKIEQDAEALFCQVKESLWIEDEGKSIAYVPADDFRVTFSLAYPEPVPIRQRLTVRVNEAEYLREVSYARTFGFTYEFDMLKAKSLALGGSLENAVVVQRDGTPMNPEGLRSETEFVRHKILDLIGDMALVGRRIRGHIVAHRTGHAYNVRFAKKLCGLNSSQTERKQAAMMNIEAIKEVLPHRYPFLLVDRILSLEPGKSAVGIKSVTANEEFFNGHFPQRAVMPGVLLTEAMAQVAGVLFLSQPEFKGKLPFFVGIDRMRFRKPVVPGDRLEMHVTVKKLRGNTGRVAVETRVDGETVCDGELMFTIL